MNNWNWKEVFKRSTALLLALVMILSMTPVTVLAGEGTETEENPWSGRSAVFVGDSITAGTGTTKIYYEYLEETLGFGSVTAMGVGGSCISAASDYGQRNQPLISRYQDIPSADLIVVFMGTNDYGHETPLGTAEDTQDGTFYGALNTIIPFLVEKHPSSKIVFVTSLHRYGAGTSKILGTKFTYDHLPNGVGATLGDYVTAAKTVCAKNGVSVIDLHTECTLDPSDAAVRAEYMPDGIHPNAAGHEVIAGIMESHILEYEPVEKEPVVLPEMIQGNKFASSANQSCRASSRVNYYLKAGTVITLKDPEAMQWACARTSNEFSSNNLGYFPEKQWTDLENAVVSEDGWIGFTFKYRDETKSFDLTKPLSDYITIEEPHTHSYEKGVCTGCGAKDPEYVDFSGKKVSILSHSMSTYAGVSNNPAYNSTIGSNDVYYTAGRHGVYREDTWWQQAIDALGMELLVNNSWSGSCVFMPRKGEASVGYGDRAVNLHNDSTGVEPDIIWVYLGCNDFAYYKETFGLAEDIDYSLLILDNGDGTFTYAEPKTTCEAYGIMLHKVENRYPEAEIYCITSTARRDPDYADNYADTGQPTAYSAELHKVAAYFGFPVVDLENCIPKEAELFDQYIGDKRAHANALGMDQITNAVLSVMLGRSAEICHVTSESGTVAEQAVLLGGSYCAQLKIPVGCSVTVTMDGSDITDSCKDGRISISCVTGDIAVTVKEETVFGMTAGNWESGTIDSKTGLNKDNATRLRTEEDLRLADYLGVSVGAEYTMAYFAYDADGNYLGNSVDWLGGGVGFSTKEVLEKYPSAISFRVAVRHLDSGAIALSDLPDMGVTFYPANAEPKSYLWNLRNDELVSVGQNENSLTMLSGTVTDGRIQDGRYWLETSVVLKHDYPWEVRWKCAGDWRGVLLSSDGEQKAEGMTYLSRVNGGQLCFGTWTGTQYDNFGMDISQLDDEAHTYRLVNRIAEDGSNRVWLYLDDAEMGPMNQYFIGSSAQNAASEWVSGRDFVFSYIGIEGHALRNCVLEYLQVFEAGHSHTYEKGICTGCGAENPEYVDFSGKKVSILGDSISTYSGVSNDSSANSTIGSNAVYYSTGSMNRADTWWQQTIDALNMELLVNNSWSGSCILHTRSNTVGAYVDRCVQLHNDQTGEEPDVILVFMGTNDFSYYQSKLGTADIDYDALITENADGSFTYATPTTSCEAYAIMLHKMTRRYPDAEIYCMTMMARRNPIYSGADVGQPTAFNAELVKIIKRFGCTPVDMESCGITSEPANFDLYMGDKRVHPNAAGMDKMTEAVIHALAEENAEVFTLTAKLTNAVLTEEGSRVLLSGSSYRANIACTFGFADLQVTVTMGGVDITDSCYADGVIEISNVTADIVVTAQALTRIPQNYRWEFDGNDLVTVGDTENSLTKLAGTTSEGVFASTRYQMSGSVLLQHDLPWVVEWKGEGEGGFMLAASSNATAAPFFFRRAGNYLNAFGDYDGSQYNNYGIALDTTDIDGSAEHVYRLENCIASDGSNMVYLWVDGVEVSALNHYYVGGSAKGTTGDWISGENFVFSHIGTTSHPLTNYTLEYLQVWENGEPAETLALRYDDYYDITGKTVEIVDAGTPTSYKVGYGVAEGTLDDAVVTLDGNTLIATGIGTALVRIDGQLYEVTVTAAPISLFMITGHSMGAGQAGTASQSVLCEEGQVYSSHGVSNLATDTAGVGISYAAGKKANNVNAFTSSGSGTIGEGSALGYSWNKLTGEKAWILNTAVGGSCLPEWIEGKTNYKNAVKQFQRAQKILQNEIYAGHYTLSHMGILYHNGANFSYKGYSYTPEELQAWYDSMWSGFKRDLTADMDGDGIGETVSFLGLIPIWTASGGQKYTQDEPAGLYMAASEAYPDVFLASTIGSQWLSNDSVATNFPEMDYPVHSGSLSKPSTTAEVFASDRVHYKQAAYNAVGADIANNLAAYLYNEAEDVSVKISLTDDFADIAETVAVSDGQDLMLVPHVMPIWCNDLCFEVSGNITMTYPMVISATGNGEGTLTISRDGVILKTVSFMAACEKEKLSLLYDDRYDVTGKTVQILDAGTPTSYKVGYGVAEGTLDDAVVTQDGDTLIATGIGTALVRIDGQLYEVTVTAAPISLLLLAGQSNMQGIDGDPNQSVICPDGQVYATYADRYKKTVEDVTKFAPSALTGPYSSINVTGDTACLENYPVHMLTEAGNGREGMDSGLAYEWVRQTGEKVWVINLGYGGSSITQWQLGGEHYEALYDLFTACQDTLRKEIEAGHFTLSHMGYFWCQGCADETQTAKWYADQFLTMHETFQRELAFEEEVTFEFAGIIPIRAGHSWMGSYRAGAYKDTTTVPYYQSFLDLRFNGPRVAQYWMGNNPVLTDIWNVCTIQEGWATLPDGSDSVAEYFRSAYENGRVDYPVQVAQTASWYTPTTPAAVHDNIHYNQIGYNELGREAARNALILLGETEAPEAEATVEFMTWDGFTPATQINASTTGCSGTLVVPMVYPVWKSKEVTYTVGEGLKYEYYDLMTDSPMGSGTLSAVGAQGSVAVAPRELASYCWTFDGSGLVNDASGDFTENSLKLLGGSVADGQFSNMHYQLTHGIRLLHDQPWGVEIELENWTATSGSMILSTQTPSSGEPYFYFRPSDYFVGIGYYDAGQYHNYGISLKDKGIDCGTGTHIYRFVNCIAEDGSNSILIIVDGEQIGALTDHYVNSTLNDTNNNWVSGQDFVMSCFGNSSFPIRGCAVNYILACETDYDPQLHIHVWSPWETVSVPSVQGPGMDQRSCTVCGEQQTRQVEGVWQTYDLEDHMVELPETFCAGTDLWDVLEHNEYYYHSGEKWAIHESGQVYSVTFAVSGGERIWATSFGKYGENNNTIGTGNGIRLTFFDANGVLKTMDPNQTYAEFAANGYLTVPEGAVAVNIPMYGNDESNDLYILSQEHDYQGTTCTVCGAEHPEAANYSGKVISILGDSISTFAGYIPVADGFNLTHLARYPQDNLLTDVNETWWMQVVTQLDAQLGINDSWRGSTVSGYPAVTTGVAGYLAAMSNPTQIQNLGSNGTPDVILFYGGTNDLAHTPKLGSFDPATAPTQVDLTTLKWDNMADGYVNTLLRLKHFYPDAQIVCLLPTYTASYYSNDKLAQGNALLAAICEHYGVAYVDLRYSGISTADLPDGIHPDATGMDYITAAVLDTLFAQCEMDAGENKVYSVSHTLSNAEASLGYYKGISAGKSFAETLTSDTELTVTVTMGGKDITAECYADGTVSIASVTGDLVITAKAAFSLGDRLQQLPDPHYGINLWPILEHDADYYSANGWTVHSSGKVKSVTIPVIPGEKLYASSFEASPINGGTVNGIRITFFDEDGALISMSADAVYQEFEEKGYVTVPAGANAVNIPMWTDSDAWELYIHIPGDINGDGDVNNKDLTRLFRYLTGYEVEVVEAALDINGDGSVNNKDQTRLFRYLSGWEVEIF